MCLITLFGWVARATAKLGAFWLYFSCHLGVSMGKTTQRDSGWIWWAAIIACLRFLRRLLLTCSAVLLLLHSRILSVLAIPWSLSFVATPGLNRRSCGPYFVIPAHVELSLAKQLERSGIYGVATAFGVLLSAYARVVEILLCGVRIEKNLTLALQWLGQSFPFKVLRRVLAVICGPRLVK